LVDIDKGYQSFFEIVDINHAMEDFVEANWVYRQQID
jgi:hypothetical protein